MKSLLSLYNKIEKEQLQQLNEIQNFSKDTIVYSISGINTGHKGKVLGYSRKGGSIIVEFNTKKYLYSFNKRINENISYLKILKKKILYENLDLHVYSFVRNPDTITILLKKKKYEAPCDERIYLKFKNILLHSKGQAISFLKKNCKLKPIE